MAESKVGHDEGDVKEESGAQERFESAIVNALNTPPKPKNLSDRPIKRKVKKSE